MKMIIAAVEASEAAIETVHLLINCTLYCLSYLQKSFVAAATQLNYYNEPHVPLQAFGPPLHAGLTTLYRFRDVIALQSYLNIVFERAKLERPFGARE